MTANRAELEGKVAIITGAGSGIGSAIATGLAAQGCSVAIADIDGAKAEAVAVELESTGAPSIELATDVSQTAGVDTMVEEAVAQFGRLDIMINNAGKYARSVVAEFLSVMMTVSSHCRSKFSTSAPRERRTTAR